MIVLNIALHNKINLNNSNEELVYRITDISKKHAEKYRQ